MYCFWWLMNLQLVSGCLVTKFSWGSNSSRAATSGRISQTSTSTIAPPAMSPSALGSPSKVLANALCLLMHVYQDVVCYCSPKEWSNSSHAYICRLSFSQQRLHQSSTLLTASATPLASDSQRPDGTLCLCPIWAGKEHVTIAHHIIHN